MNDGQVRGRGASLLLIHTVGARTGATHVTPVTGIRQGDDGWLVSAAKAGSDRSPAWYFNAIAHPEVVIEAPGEGAIPVRATELHAEARNVAWARFLAKSSRFRRYETRTTRTIPVLRLTRIAPAPPGGASDAARAELLSGPAAADTQPVAGGGPGGCVTDA
ncbi:nitroreductase family deazaflavin-dependent oxidoreductase [Microbacterium kribbense]